MLATCLFSALTRKIHLHYIFSILSAAKTILCPLLVLINLYNSLSLFHHSQNLLTPLIGHQVKNMKGSLFLWFLFISFTHDISSMALSSSSNVEDQDFDPSKPSMQGVQVQGKLLFLFLFFSPFVFCVCFSVFGCLLTLDWIFYNGDSSSQSDDGVVHRRR